jgi:hypothetical protein
MLQTELTLRASHQFLTAVRVSGATGNYSAYINGVYLPSEEVHNGPRLYTKEGDEDKWLCLNENGKWSITTEGEEDAGWCESEFGLIHPTLGKSWRVNNDDCEDEDECEVQAGFTVTSLVRGRPQHLV